jgi:hypothetical protein
VTSGDEILGLLRLSDDFTKIWFRVLLLSMVLLRIVEFLLIYSIVSFPDGILETETQVLQGTTK